MRLTSRTENASAVAAVNALDHDQLVHDVEAAKHGDRHAFDLLVERFRPAVFSQAMRIVHRTHAAEDLTQDAFVIAWQKLAMLRQDDRFGPWVRCIARHVAMNSLRRKQDVSLELAGTEGTEPDNPVTKALYDEQDAVVRSCINALCEMDRDCLRAFYWERMSLVEMADEFDCPVGTIKRRLHVARRRLQLQLLACGYFDASFDASHN